MPKGPVSIARGSTGRKQAPKKGTADGWHKKTRPEPGGGAPGHEEEGPRLRGALWKYASPEVKNAARSLAGRAALEKILFDQTNSHARNEITQSLLCRQVFAPKFTKIFLHGSWNGAIRWAGYFL